MEGEIERRGSEGKGREGEGGRKGRGIEKGEQREGKKGR